jgi:geranylgeranyl diphosphate synthase type I
MISQDDRPSTSPEESSVALIIERYRPAIVGELRSSLEGRNVTPYTLMRYHLGWEDRQGRPIEGRSGKLLRPALCLLCCEAVRGDARRALPAASALELLHNFSLIHDDIEDNSPTRRNRPTLWSLWGVPQAINTGDAMYSLAYQAMASVRQDHSPETTLEAMEIFEVTTLELTKGQFMDISFEDRDLVTVEEYEQMITGKTAALIGASVEIGAVLANVGEETRQAYRDFGANLGLAFQVQDDYLGIWGDEELTGKSTATDIQEKKKTLPILYGLNQIDSFRQVWSQESISEADVERMAKILEAGGARSYTRKAARRYYNEAKTALKRAHPTGEAAIALDDLIEQLLHRSQ